MASQNYPRTVSNGAEEGEGYLASLSDLMVGLLFIFIIILMSFALKLRVAEDQTAAETQRKAQETKLLQGVTEKLTRDTEIRQRMLEQIRDSLEQQGVRVQLDLRNGVLRLPEELLFDSASADFRDQGKVAIGRLAQALSIILPCYSGDPSPAVQCLGALPIRLDAILIEGHTDNRPIRNQYFADNWMLSSARARRTYDELMSFAPGLAQMINAQQQPLFSMSAYAYTRPVADNMSEEGRRKNRRIDLRFILAAPEREEVDRIRKQLKF